MLPSDQIAFYLGKGSGTTLRQLGVSEDLLAQKLTDIENSLDKAREKRTASDYFELEQKLFEELYEHEAQLRSHFDDIENNSLELLSHTKDSLAELLSPTENKGLYFRVDKVITILREIPPRQLMSAYEVNTIDKLITKLTPREALSLTRHTEDKNWKAQYYEKLIDCKPDDFEELELEIACTSSDIFNTDSVSHIKNSKPWFISHSKEVGVINLFTREPCIFKTPSLLLTSVFLHYVYEISFASCFCSYLAKTNEQFFGYRVSKLVHNNRVSFPFLTDKNAYDETIYWDKALEKLSPILKLDRKQLNSSSSLAFHADRLHSLNFIDMLWMVNLDQTSIDYHFKESLWKDLIQQAARLEDAEIESILIKNLDSDDKLLTDRILRV